MPFYNDNETQIGPFTPRVKTPQEQADEGLELEGPGFVDSVGAAFRTENTVGSFFSDVTLPESPFNPDYDPIEKVPDEFRIDAEKYARANSDEEVEAITTQLRRETADRQTLRDAGGYGILAMLTAGVFDPINFVPFVGSVWRAKVVGHSVLKAALITGYSNAASATAAEVALHNTQLKRTMGESAINITAGAFLGGVLGGGARAITRIGARSSDMDPAAFMKNLEAKVEADLEAPPPTSSGGTAGAARPEDLLDEPTQRLLTEEADGLVASGKMTREEADEALVLKMAQTLMDRSGIKKNVAVAAALKVLGHQDLTLRMLENEDIFMRRLGPQLFETPLQLGKNSMNEATDVSIQALVRNYAGPLNRAVKQGLESYSQYAVGRSRGMLDSVTLPAQRLGGLKKLSEKEFRVLVTKAMRSGDDAADIPGIPKDAVAHVNTSAAAYRKEVFDPLKDAAIELGLLPKDVTSKTAASYMMRSWNTETLKSAGGRERFLDTTTSWLATRQEGAARSAEDFAGDEAKLKSAVAELKDEIRGTTRATGSGTAEAATKATDEKVAEVLAGVELKLDETIARILKVDAPAKAKTAAVNAFRRAFEKEMKQDVVDAVEDAVSTNATKISDDIAKQIDELEGTDVLALVRDELSFAGKDVAGAAGAKAARGSASSAKLAGYEAAAKAFERSLKASESRLKKLLEDSEGLTAAARKAALSDIQKNIAKTARNEARVAVASATKETREKLSGVVKELAQRRKLNKRDIIERDMSPAELRSLAQEIHGHLLSTPVGRLPYDRAPEKMTGFTGGKNNVSHSPAFKERTFLIPDHLVDEFLENDIETLAKLYTKSVAPEVAMLKKFGSLDMRKEFAAIESRFQANMNKPGVDGKKELAVRDRNMKDLETARDRLLNRRGLPDDPTTWVHRTSHAARTLNYIRLLGGMTVSAFPDMARPVQVHGMINTFNDGLLPLITQLKRSRLLFDEMENLGLVSEMISNNRMQAAADIMDDTIRGNMAERALGVASDTFGKVSLMAPWNQAWKQLAGAVSMARLLRAIEADVLGNISAKERTNLRAATVSHEMSKRISQQVALHKADGEGLILPNVLAWTDKNAASNFQAAVGRDIDRTIVTPGLDKPSMADSGEVGKHLFAFKSFAFAATSRILLSGLQQSDMAAMNGLVLSVALGMLTASTKLSLAGRGDELEDWTVEKALVAGIDRSGSIGIIADLHNITEKVTGFGANQFTGMSSEKYASRNPTGAVLGPSSGLLADMLRALGAGGTDGFSGADLHAIRKILPYQNLFYARWMFDNMESGLVDVLGLKPRK